MPEDDRALDADAALLQPFDPVPDIVRGVEDRLVHIPAAGFRSQVQDLVVVLDRMADPFLFERDQRPEQVLFPLVVLRHGVVHEEQAVVLDRGHLADHIVDRPRPEFPAAQERRAAAESN